jgi:manganese transport system ATP-binding protein
VIIILSYPGARRLTGNSTSTIAQGSFRALPDPARGAAVHVTGLGVRYPGGDGPALVDIGLRVPVGTRVAIVGANGSGKSTLLKVLAGVVTPQEGTVEVLGSTPEAARRQVAYMAQRADVDWDFPMSVRQLAMTGRIANLGRRRRPRREDRDIVERELERVGLAGLAERRIADLSGGQRQRMLLARALVQEPELLLLDEPDAAMDSQGVELLGGVLDEAQRTGSTALIATHAADRLEGEVDGAFYLADGRRAAPHAGAFVGLEVGAST